MQASMQAHMADLEAELVIKESQLRARETEVSELVKFVSDLMKGASGTSGQNWENEKRTIRKLGLLKESILIDIQSLTSNTRVQESLEKSISDVKRALQNESERLQLRVTESQAEVRQLRKLTLELESELKDSSDKLNQTEANLKSLADSVNESRISGFLSFSLVRGNSMTVPEARFVCLHDTYGEIFHADLRSVDESFMFDEFSVKSEYMTDSFVMEFSSRSEALTLRLVTSAEGRTKWHRACGGLFTNSLRRLRSGDSEGRQLTDDDSQDADDASGFESLSSLASEVRLSFPSIASRQQEPAIKESIRNSKRRQSDNLGRAPSVYNFSRREHK